MSTQIEIAAESNPMKKFDDNDKKKELALQSQGFYNNTLCYPCDCCIHCALPSMVSVICFAIPCFTKCQRAARHDAELFMLRRPFCCSFSQCCCYYMDLWYDCSPGDVRQLFFNRKEMYGTNRFVFQNKVVVWDKEISEKILLREEGRGPYLGATNLITSHLPKGENGRSISLLTLSGTTLTKGYDQNDHKAFRNALMSLTTAPDCLERASPLNPTMMSIIQKFEADITSSCLTREDVINIPMKKYLIRSMHWCILELDLTDAELSDLMITHYGKSLPTPVLWHLWGLSFCLSDQEGQYSKAAPIYYRSPKLSSWVVKLEYNNLTMKEFVRSLQAVLTIAGLQGPYAMTQMLVLQSYKHLPPNFVMPMDRERIRLVMLESNRLNPAVVQTCVVPEKQFRCPFAGHGDNGVVFPKSTPLTVNFALHGRNPDMWKDPEKFDPYNRDLWGPTSRYTFFNGVGDNGPRLCPGRDLGVDLSITAVKSLFKTPMKQPNVKLCGLVKVAVKEIQGLHPFDKKCSPNTLGWKKIALSISKAKPAEHMPASVIKHFSPKFLARPTFKMAGYTFFVMGKETLKNT